MKCRYCDKELFLGEVCDCLNLHDESFIDDLDEMYEDEE